ncbi:DUF2441 domain-containing protein [Pseudomonas sp. WS 5059]|uniref:DUF2441 domain-containing protein n=1 Tax=unclassified Pseudomonas TaxID=196821 RepID=UPI0014737AD2|nr:DUF2441 domain-containing protein [Pseudomonas sp. WS 5059]NMY04293.1 DUF2441 domain-containing protein [Pseudomonas sp. WS 5059]
MKYYHIDTESRHRTNWDQFRTGEEYVVGDKINPIYTNWKNSATRVGGGITREDVHRSVSVMLRELAFENLRARVYSTLPSRTNCIWLCDSEESARYWIKRLPHSGSKRILEIEILEGLTHKAYEQHLTNNLENINELEVRAHNYWSGHGAGNYEILFQGVMHIAREIYP